MKIDLDKTLILFPIVKNEALSKYKDLLNLNISYLNKLGYNNILVVEEEPTVTKTLKYNALSHLEILSKLDFNVASKFEWIMVFEIDVFVLKNKELFQNHLNNFEIRAESDVIFVRDRQRMLNRIPVLSQIIFKLSSLETFVNLLKNEWNRLDEIGFNNYISELRQIGGAISLSELLIKRILQQNENIFNISTFNDISTNSTVSVNYVVMSFINNNHILVPFADGTMGIHDAYIENHINELYTIHMIRAEDNIIFVKNFLDKFILGLPIEVFGKNILNDKNIRSDNLTEK